MHATMFHFQGYHGQPGNTGTHRHFLWGVHHALHCGKRVCMEEVLLLDSKPACTCMKPQIQLDLLLQ
ncbi:hypothetical protein ILYODFUR_004156 [Ilyodon furcidens]|uniref:Uncharacterized protein n=1 Tax=Ilyodon furcidens TaxID=33524 RepID=A0ABV0UQS6_9TELE